MKPQKSRTFRFFAILEAFMIKRDFYLNQLIAKRHSSKVKIITGLRRSGKSYLLLNIYKQYLLEDGIDEKQIIVVSLDDEENDILREKGKLREYVEKRANDDKLQYYIIIDEVQLATDFVRAVNSLNKHKKSATMLQMLKKDLIIKLFVSFCFFIRHRIQKTINQIKNIF